VVYTANWGIIWYLPPIKGTRKLHWLLACFPSCWKKKLLLSQGISLESQGSGSWWSDFYSDRSMDVFVVPKKKRKTKNGKPPRWQCLCPLIQSSEGRLVMCCEWCGNNGNSCTVLETIILRFHVKLGECSMFYSERRFVATKSRLVDSDKLTLLTG